MNAESMGRSMVDQAERQRVLKVLTAATFLVFAQAFMVAPLIPRLAEIFQVAPETIGIVVPAYLIPYGLMNLVWGPLSDRLGRGKVILGSLGAFVLLTAASASVGSAGGFIAARVLTAVGASAAVPISLALMGDLYEFQERGRPLGWLFGAMAGGMAVGSSAGALLEPAIGWQGLFIGTAGLGGIVLLLLLPSRGLLAGGGARVRRPVGTLIRGYLELLKMARGRRTYGFVLLNAILHSGIYTWLGLYFHRRYGLSEVGIGLALLGYGVPGFVFGPVIGRLADRKGRGRLIPLGLATAALSAIVLAAPAPLLLAAVAVAVLSLGYDLTQPLLAGIVTDLSPNRGQAMGLNVFTLFIGFGLGSLVFQALLQAGLPAALATFGGVALLGGGLAWRVFSRETGAVRRSGQ